MYCAQNTKLEKHISTFAGACLTATYRKRNCYCYLFAQCYLHSNCFRYKWQNASMVNVLGVIFIIFLDHSMRKLTANKLLEKCKHTLMQIEFICVVGTSCRMTCNKTAQMTYQKVLSLC